MARNIQELMVFGVKNWGRSYRKILSEEVLFLQNKNLTISG